MTDERTALLNPDPSINSDHRLRRNVTVADNVHEIYPSPEASATQQMKGSGKFYYSILACVIGTSFQFGYALGALNNPQKVIECAYKYHFSTNYSSCDPQSDSDINILWSVTVSIYCFGGLISGCFGGALGARLGRKRALMLINILQVIAGALMFSSLWLKVFEVIIVGRFVAGLHGGLATVICPQYLNEISPASFRGATGTVNQLTVVLGLSLSQIIGLEGLLGSDHYFYYILGIPMGVAILFWILMAFAPESPAWLYMTKHDRVAATIALESLRVGSVSAEIAEYEEAVSDEDSQTKVTLKDMFTTYRRRPLGVIVVMHMSQQLSGINAVIFFSTSIFKLAGLRDSIAQYATLGLGGIQLIMTFVSMLLIDRLGRRTLHLHGLGGMFICLALLTACLKLQVVVTQLNFGSIAAVGLFMVSFSIGPGSIPWFYTSELFDQASQRWAISIATAVNWLCNFLVGLLFLPLQTAMGPYVFLIFIVLLALFFAYLYLRMPETKGKSILEITSKFRTIHSMLNLPAEERRQYQTFQ